MRLLQFVFSLCLILGAFLAGLYAGWRRWGVRPPEPTWDTTRARGIHDDTVGGRTDVPRRSLFSPEVDVVDLRSDATPTPPPAAASLAPPVQRAIAPAAEPSPHEEQP